MKAYSPLTLARGFSVLTFSTLLGATHAAAQEGSGRVDFEPIVITGEKVERDLKNTASSVTVKSGREIDKEKTGSSTVTEVLNDVPNVIYTDSVGAPVIRGMDSHDEQCPGEGG